MFCPKCGVQNPENGKFCRSCGTDLGNVSDALTGKLQKQQSLVNRRGRPITIESAITKLFMGIAFLAIAIVLGVTGRGSGWWFWMLIPALMFVGSGIAQYLQVRSVPHGGARIVESDQPSLAGHERRGSLPTPQTEFVSPDTDFKTGDLVPPSVTDSTTRRLELNSEGETMTLPKK